MAVPSCSPGYHPSMTPATLPSQGMSTGPPVWSTTTVRGLAAATAAIRALSSPGRDKDGRSKASELKSPAKTTATCALAAAATAAAIRSLTYCHPRVRALRTSKVSPEGVRESNGSQFSCTRYGWPPTSWTVWDHLPLAWLRVSETAGTPSRVRLAPPDPWRERVYSPVRGGVSVPDQLAATSVQPAGSTTWVRIGDSDAPAAELLAGERKLWAWPTRAEGLEVGRRVLTDGWGLRGRSTVGWTACTDRGPVSGSVWVRVSVSPWPTPEVGFRASVGIGGRGAVVLPPSE